MHLLDVLGTVQGRGQETIIVTVVAVPEDPMDTPQVASHLQLAARLAIGQAPAQLLAQARATLARWVADGSRTPEHIARWQRILQGDQQRISARLAALDRKHAVPLFNDSPFGRTPRLRAPRASSPSPSPSPLARRAA